MKDNKTRELKPVDVGVVKELAHAVELLAEQQKELKDTLNTMKASFEALYMAVAQLMQEKNPFTPPYVPRDTHDHWKPGQPWMTSESNGGMNHG